MTSANVDHRLVSVVVEDDVSFTLEALCRACAIDEDQVLALVDDGVLDPVGSGPHDWLFAGAALRTVRTTVRLAVDLELGLTGAAIVLDLLQQIDAMRARLRRAGID